MPGRAMDPITVPAHVWQRPEMVDALRKRDIGRVFKLVQQFTGASQTRIGSACNLTQGKVSKYEGGKTQVETLTKFEEIADGLGMSDQARMTLGLAPRGPDLRTSQQATTTYVTTDSGDRSSTADASSAAGMVVPCRASDGRIIWVSIPRRAFLLGSVAAATKSLRARHGSVRPGARVVGASPADPSPIEHFERMRLMLVESDNLLGPRHVIRTVHEQVPLIQQLRSEAKGADRRALQRLQTWYAEFASWLHHDAGDLTIAREWTDRALAWSQGVGDPAMTAYIFVRKSQLAGDMRDPTSAVDYAEAALDLAPSHSKLKAAAEAFTAYGYAMQPDGEDLSLRMLDEAHATLADLDEDPGSPWAVWMNDAYLNVERARCLTKLGDHANAAEIFHQAIDDLPEGFHRDRGVYLAREALAHAGAGQIEQAARVGTAALSVAIDTESARIINELAHLDIELATWQRLPDVAEFREYLTTVLPRERSEG